MTRLQTALPRAYAPPGLLASVAVVTALNSENPPTTMAGDPKATAAGKPPRDLTDTHKALDLEGYPGAVCLVVPKLSPDEMTAALKILMGSTNGRYVDDATAKKLLADKKAPGAKTFRVRWGAGKKLDSVAVLTHELGLLRRAHHSEPRRVAGTPDIRGEHVAVH